MTQPVEVSWKNSRLRLATGSYTGNGSTTGREIDIGFQPDLVQIKHGGTARVFELFSANESLEVVGGALSNDIINNSAVHTSTNGFTVGDGNNSGNQNTETYHYRAWGIE